MCMNQLSKLYHEVHLKTAHTSVNCWTKCKKKRKEKKILSSTGESCRNDIKLQTKVTPNE